MSFYHLPHPYNPGYVIPDYVMAEPPGRGTFTTKWLPRGTISDLVPDYLAKPGKTLLGRNDAGLGSLGCPGMGGTLGGGSSLDGDTLGAVERTYTLESLGGTRSRARRAMEAMGSSDAADSIGGAYGTKAAAWIMASIEKVPAAQRKAALRALLDTIDPTLWAAIEQKGSELKANGMSAKQSLGQAIALAMANGMSRELVAMGKRARAGDPSPVKDVGQLGVAARVPTATFDALDALGFSLSSLNPINIAKNIGSAIAGGVNAAETFVVAGVKKVGGLACGVINAAGAGGAGAAAMANPAVGAGVLAAQGLCPQPKSATPAASTAAADAAAAAAASSSSTPTWVAPVAVAAGGGLLLLLLL